MTGQNIILSMSLSSCLLKGDVNFPSQDSILLLDFFAKHQFNCFQFSGTKFLDKLWPAFPVPKSNFVVS